MPDEELENKTWSKVRGLPLSLLLFNMVPEVLAKKTKKKEKRKRKKERKKKGWGKDIQIVKKDVSSFVGT